MLKISKLKQISIAMFAIAISAFLIMSCAKQDKITQKSSEISQELITPQAIVRGDIDPASLTKEQRISFLKQHSLTKTPELSYDLLGKSRYFIMKDMPVNDLFEAFKGDPDIDDEESWKQAFLIRAMINSGMTELTIFPEKYTEDELKSMYESNFNDEFQKKLTEDASQKAHEKVFLESSWERSSSCYAYSFPLRGNKASGYNLSCVYVGWADTPGDNDCDYHLAFSGFSCEIYAGTSPLNYFLLTLHILGDLVDIKTC